MQGVQMEKRRANEQLGGRKIICQFDYQFDKQQHYNVDFSFSIVSFQSHLRS